MSQVEGSLPAAVARAYAILDLRPGCSERALKVQYKRLVKRWHPDQFSSDPVGQADATIRVRQIIEAYGAIDAYRASAGSQRTAAPSTQVTAAVDAFHSAPASRDRPHWSAGRPLTAEEKETIARAIGYRRPIPPITRGLAWVVPFVFGCIALIGRRRPGGAIEVTPVEAAAGIFLLSYSAAVFVCQAWLNRRRR